jgi:hypothetical protein
MLLDTPKVRLLEIISKLQAEVEVLRKDAAWKPIETAPKDKYILVTDFGEYPDAPDIYVAEWFDFGKYWSTSHGCVHGVSHWMPLPKPPIEGEAT